MNLQKLNTQELDQSTFSAVKTERGATTFVLKHLQEIERRRYFYGYKSLFDYTVQRLGYSEDEAFRRIAAMRVMKEIPAIEEKIDSGAISLTHIGIAQSLFRHEAKNHGSYSAQEKLEVLEKIEHTSTRQAQRITLSMASSPMTKTVDQIRPISETNAEFKFAGPLELEEMLNNLKGLLAHSNPNITTAELLIKLCELGFKAWDPAYKKTKPVKEKEATPQPTQDLTKADNSAPSPDAASPVAKRVKPQPRRPYMSVNLKQEVWRRDRSCCTQCGSTYALEIDHCKPIALGGENMLENLRLLCRACNQRAAIKTFGAEQMGKYLR